MSSVAAHHSGITWDEFLALPHETRNAALVDGEVVVNPPNPQHELVVQNLVIAFRAWLRQAPGRGDVSTQQPVKINDRRGYQPDFMWYPPERCAPPGEPASFNGPPSLVVEVLSPSTRSFDLIRKRGDYERVGIGEVWFVDPRDERVLVCQRPEVGGCFTDRELGPGDTLASPLLDGFAVEVGELFRR
ncbi:MAG TPA: Uma2 family endonuclease [Acidimicrobiales bacterium]